MNVSTNPSLTNRRKNIQHIKSLDQFFSRDTKINPQNGF